MVNIKLVLKLKLKAVVETTFRVCQNEESKIAKRKSSPHQMTALILLVTRPLLNASCQTLRKTTEVAPINSNVSAKVTYI